MTEPAPLEADTPSVTVVVITYNSSDSIVSSLTSLEDALSNLDAEILVVDNASADSTVESATATLRKGRVIANAGNWGYARAANVGLRHARGRYALIMNDDAQLDAMTVGRLIEVLASKSRIGLVGPRIVDSHGRPTHSARLSYPGPAEEWMRLVDFVTGRRQGTDYPASEHPMVVKWLVGACVLGETELLRQVGGFNEEFFLYGEDIDLGRRLSALGLDSVTVPDAVCVHIGGVATSRTHTTDARTNRQIKGRSVYYRIWLSRATRSLVYLRRAIGIRGQPGRLRQFLPLVLWDGPSLHHKRFPEPLTPATSLEGSPPIRSRADLDRAERRDSTNSG